MGLKLSFICIDEGYSPNPKWNIYLLDNGTFHLPLNKMR